MDRREALKKMAAGGATVVGASMVLSNVAFADKGTPKKQGTNIPLATDLVVTFVSSANQKSFDSAISVPNSWSCPAGSTKRVDTYLTGSNAGYTVSNTGASYVNTRTAIITTVSTTNNAAFPLGNTTIVLQFYARFVCVSASNAWNCFLYTVTYVVNNPGGGNNLTATISVSRTSAASDPNCNTPPA